MSKDSVEIHETPSTTPNFKNELAAQLADLLPEVIVDGKVDVEKLKELLDDDVQDESERFGLFWPGKKRALRAAQEPTTATLKPMKTESKDWETTQNVLIEGDNLEVLKILQKRYHNEIKMIYIDPPYNTGKDFIYPDNYKEGLQSYLEFTRQVDEGGMRVSSNSETEGRYHSNWLNMMYPRLKLARNLLADDGVIFISIDDNEQSRLHLLCDEIFGSNNYVATITREAIRGGSVSKHIRSVHDYVLAYARNIQELSAGGVEQESEPLDLQDEKGPYRKGRELNKWGAGSRREDAPGMFYAISGPSGEEVFPIRNDGTDGRWRLGREKMRDKVASGEVTFEKRQDGTYIVYEKIRDTGPRTKQFTTLFTGTYQNSRGAERLKTLFGGSRSYFDYAKPTDLLVDLIQLANVRSGEVVLDFFAGSGTTADAVMQINSTDGEDRKFILVQLPEPLEDDAVARQEGYENIAQLTRRRLSLAAGSIVSELSQQVSDYDETLDFGYRLYKLADTNFAKWKLPSDTTADALEQRLLDLRDSSDDIATSEDLLAEILLKQGFSLTEQVERASIAGLNVYSVGDNVLFAYLDEHVKPTLDQLRKILDLGLAKFIILEDAFQGDDELKTNLKQMCKTKQIELWTA
jgi:adenine-specific DNA-methyltransferase